MTKQTKLVNCGSSIFVYDFKSRRQIKKLGFEKGVTGSVTDLQRLLLTNFVDHRLLATFKLKISLHQYGELENKINLFIDHLKITSGNSKIKYLAVLELPLTKKEHYAFIHLITDIEIHQLMINLDEDISEEDEEEYLEAIWGDELSVTVYSPSELLMIFTSAYQNSIRSCNYSNYPSIVFHSKLKRPVVLWNEDAEAFIQNHNLLDYPKYQTDEIYDDIAGFVIINEYSLYDTSSFTEEFDMNFI